MARSARPMTRPMLEPKGLPRDEVISRMRQMRAEDGRWKEGRTWSLVYFANEEVSRLNAEAYTEFMAENGLSPVAFPSLRRFENEVVGTALSLFNAGPDGAGSMTSGGTESIMMAVKTARDWARKERGIEAPEMIIPRSIHPAFMKAAHYFCVKPVLVDLGPDFRVDLEKVKAAITPNTALIVGSAPAYPHGVVDPIPQLAALAQQAGVLCHVDACLGGFHLPFAAKLGVEVPPFDFRVPGVTSLSADLHKYGFAAKGASVVLYRDRDLRRHQYFAWADWPGGLFASPTMTGTRPGGAIAAAWAVLKHLGEEGYGQIARTTLDAADALKEGIAKTPGLRVLGDPKFAIFAFASDEVDVYQLGDAMEARGWKLDRQQMPPALHLMVTPAHAKIVAPFLEDLRACAAALKRGEPAPEGSAAMYGMAGAVPDRSALDSFLVDFLDGLYDPHG